jgi:hypothetical protein
MTVQEQIKNRFAELAEQGQRIPLRRSSSGSYSLADHAPFYAWVSSALNLVQGVFGKDSPHY